MRNQATATTKLTPEVLEAGTAHLRRADARLGAVIDRVGACALRPRGRIYGTLFRAVLYQQLAGAAAAAIEKRVYGLFGGSAPRPADFLDADFEQLRRAGLSARKLEYLRELAAAFDAGKLKAQRLGRLSDEDIIAAVTTVKGIGVWTAHMLLISSLGRPDVLPVGDYGVRKGVQRLYGLRNLPESRALERIAAPWRPYRSIAAWYIWRSADLDK